MLFYTYGDALKARHMLQQSAADNGTEASVVEANAMALNAMVSESRKRCDGRL